jgi:predicted esterase
MIPFMPEEVPNLSGKNIFIGAGQYDPIVPREQTEALLVFSRRQEQMWSYIFKKILVMN